MARICGRNVDDEVAGADLVMVSGFALTPVDLADDGAPVVIRRGDNLPGCELERPGPGNSIVCAARSAGAAARLRMNAPFSIATGEATGGGAREYRGTLI